MTECTTHHQPVITLEDLLALDETEVIEGYVSAERGDPEPGMNRSRAFHHGWRVKMMDLGVIPMPDEHLALARAWVAHQRAKERAS